jgi:hypothetical protein
MITALAVSAMLAGGAQAAVLKITSSTFKEGAMIAAKYAGRLVTTGERRSLRVGFGNKSAGICRRHERGRQSRLYGPPIPEHTNHYISRSTPLISRPTR